MQHAPTHFFMVFANALPGGEDEFNRWYDEQHLSDLLKLPGFKAAQRFVLSEHQHVAGPHPQKYAVIYEIEGHDLKASLDALQAALDDGSIPKCAVFDWQTMEAHVYTPITQRLVKS